MRKGITITTMMITTAINKNYTFALLFQAQAGQQ